MSRYEPDAIAIVGYCKECSKAIYDDERYFSILHHTPLGFQGGIDYYDVKCFLAVAGEDFIPKPGTKYKPGDD